MFYSSGISQHIDLVDELRKMIVNNNSNIFNFFSYPFLLPVDAKNKIIRFNLNEKKRLQSQKQLSKYFSANTISTSVGGNGSLRYNVDSSGFPHGLAVHSVERNLLGSLDVFLCFEVNVDRSNLLGSLISAIIAAMSSDAETLKLPLRWVVLF